MLKVLAAAVLTCAALAAQAQTLGFYRFPAVQGTNLWFTAEGDLWRAAAAGGTAERITTHPGYETRPEPSPDGKLLAFVAAYEGPSEVYVMPTAGGLPRRLTWGGERVAVWGLDAGRRGAVHRRLADRPAPTRSSTPSTPRRRPAARCRWPMRAMAPSAPMAARSTSPATACAVTTPAATAAARWRASGSLT